MMFFDIETTSLNPYSDESKIILAQVRRNGVTHLFKEWELGEKQVINILLNEFCKLEKYEPVITYNGSFDFHFIMGRINELGYDIYQKETMHHIFTTIKHCDLLQFDNGYFVSLEKICNQYNIPVTYKAYGKHMKKLYEKMEWEKILLHGEEDLILLEELIEKTDIYHRYDRIITISDEVRGFPLKYKVVKKDIIYGVK